MQSSTIHVPLSDTRRQYTSIKNEVDETISKVLDSGNYILGENVERFEQEFAAYLGVKEAVGVGSGTDALELALQALEVEEGGESIAPANTFFAMVAAVQSYRGKLRLTDVEEETFNMDPETLGKTIGDRVRVLVPTHMYGQTADMDPIRELGANHSCVVVEDVAQALGASYNGRPAGALGNVSCFSFYPSKNLGAYGDAGAVASNDEELSRRIRALRNYGEDRKYHHMSIGGNSRLDEIQAAVLRVKLKHLDQWNRQRQELAGLYNELLEPLDQVTMPSVASGRNHVYGLYVIRCSQRNDLKAWLARNGVSTEIHYPRPLHLQPACEYLGYKEGDFPKSELCAGRILSLPMFPELKESEVAFVCEKITEFYQAASRRNLSRRN